jgi:putative transposase
VNNYDKITIDKMDVASMAQSDVKFLRKYIKNAAMAKAAQFIIYKAEKAGRTVDQRPIFEENSQSCSNCGTLNPQMKDGRMTLKCICCGHKMQRQKNASVNLKNCA